MSASVTLAASDQEISLFRESRIKDRAFIIMNRIESINLAVPIMQDLAKLALFREIQKTFNLHPASLADCLIRLSCANQKDLDITARDLTQKALEVFEHRLKEAQATLSRNRGSAGLLEESLMTKYFNLDPAKVVKTIRGRIREAGGDPEKLVDGKWAQAEMVLICLRDAVGEMVPWTFHIALVLARRKVAAG
jgi:hypothetical protein